MTLGIMAALARRGLRVAPFKIGPDFIDPGHHTRVTGVISRNLDGWMLSERYNRDCFERHTRGTDIAVAEGVMGLFDGYDGRTDAGSTAQMARWLGLPVLLVVNARSMARSVAPLVQGFERFDPSLRFAGVLFNNIGSPNHLTYLKDALEGHVRMPCLGGILRDDRIAIPERHLGLVTQDEHPLSGQHTDRLVAMIENRMNLDALLDGLPERPPETGPPAPGIRTPSVRIGVASDRAFCFYYQDNLDILEKNGAEIVRFSPLDAPALPERLDGLYFGGGYPELFARQLAGNTALRSRIKELSRAGMPIYGECGGFMYLCRELRDVEGTPHPMTGCFPMVTAMYPRLKSLGYRQVTQTRDSVLGPAGQQMRGHEFHYSEIISDSDGPATVYSVEKRIGNHRTAEGFSTARTLGSYVHLHFGSRPEVAGHFIKACQAFQQERKSVS
ncbi:cobyrinate a,c-diamide synthase [Desulfonema ishimotonii]|uniref:Cobyrinate a,c-diamide synthase n=1 Tax=Desulfonema ishimotonii TaxID=45657 RepID=A0A401G482_9BACT|nr:cobyrinate a,c-diamide synthase [Desulfonema ishimotonii]